MHMQKQGMGGSGLAFPLQTIIRASGASMDMISTAWFSHVGAYYWWYEDFLWDAFDAAEHPLAIYDASASGTPTTDLVADATGGAFQIKLASTSEAETAGFTMGDNLYIQGNKPFFFLTRLKVVQAMAANQVMVWGLASDVNTATLDNIARNAWFRLDADTDLLIETDDATTDSDDKDTGIDMTADTYYWFAIEGGVDGTTYFRVAEGDGDNRKTFTMTRNFSVSAEPSFGANNFQPVILAQKASGTTQPEFVIDMIAFAGARV